MTLPETDSSAQMTHGVTFDGLSFDPTSIIEGVSGIFIILQLAFFIFYAYTQYMLSKKLEVKYSWMAWIPILNYFNTLFIAGKTIGWWAKWYILPGVLLIGLSIISGAMRDSWMIGLGFFAFIITLIIATVKLNHGVSTRTGHGGWWTVGLMLAGWLFWPVTAFHYEKGDEITPRPFTGWKNALLVICGVLLPIIMILGILAAALFPALTGYLHRSRDAAREFHLKDASTMLGAYYSDKESYPESTTSGCFPNSELTSYNVGNSLQDPNPINIMPGCDGTDGTYAYRNFMNEDGMPHFVIGAKMERRGGGNSSLPIDEITLGSQLVKGSGPYYYIVK